MDYEMKTYPITIESKHFHLLIFGIEYKKKVIKLLNLVLKKYLVLYIFNKSFELSW